MATQAEYIQNIKARKNGIYTLLGSNMYFNHPHRITSFGLSGSLALVIDNRTAGSVGTVTFYDFSLDFSDATPYTRIFEPFAPWAGTPPPSGLSEGEILLGHRPSSPWRIEPFYGARNASVVIGSVTKKTYSRTLVADPWVEDTTNNYYIHFNFNLAVSGGGDPTSGGYNATALDANKTLIGIGDNYDGTSGSAGTGLLPDFGANIYRFPHESTWANESAIFSDIFDDYLTAGGATYSGTCSLSLDFSY